MQDLTIIDQEKHKIKQIYDHQIYYVNIDVRHQYGIFVAEVQTSQLVKCPQGREKKRDGCFLRLW